MAKVWCAESMCKHNKHNQCRAKEVNLAAGHKHTVHDGFCHVWTCRSFEMSKHAIELHDALKKHFKELAGKDGMTTRGVIFDEFDSNS